MLSFFLVPAFVFFRVSFYVSRFILAHVTRPTPDKTYYPADGKSGYYHPQDIRVCVAVSIDEDAAGLYYRYSFNLGNYNLLLHPKLAVWPASNSYFLTFDSKDNNQSRHT